MTDVDSDGLSNRQYGYCNDDCPVEEEYLEMQETQDYYDGHPWCEGDCAEVDNTTWGSDQTLRVTTHYILDPTYIYIPSTVLATVASSLLIIAAFLKYFGSQKPKNYEILIYLNADLK